ncbi:MAG: hypothetical protein M1538_03655 [Candidatus Marsarchaeota archaeon]|jgi:phosphomevalonate kinase|nr:hypothetical protein [Candidatus Marsarchaeota archaeon]
MYIEAKASGKILWLGGYSVLERPNIGYVTTIDSYVHVYLELIDNSDKIYIKVPQFKVDLSGSINLQNGKLKIERLNELNLLLTTVEVTLSYVLSKGYKLKGMKLYTKNDKALIYNIMNVNPGLKKISKTGMGSSSAVTVAVVASILSAYNLDMYENDCLHKLAQISYSTAVKKIGSGFDIAAATYGSIEYIRYSPSLISDFPYEFSSDDVDKIVSKKWDYQIKKVQLPIIFDTLIANFINESSITTSLVGSVNEFKKHNPEVYANIINEINKSTKKAVNALYEINNSNNTNTNKIEEFIEEFEKSRLATKQLGKLSNTEIETDDITELIEKSKLNGALVARSPGAGGKDSLVALSLKGEKDKLKKFWSTINILELLETEVQNNGCTVTFYKDENLH